MPRFGCWTACRISVFEGTEASGALGKKRTAGMGAGAVTRGLGAAGAGVAARAAGALATGARLEQPQLEPPPLAWEPQPPEPPQPELLAPAQVAQLETIFAAGGPSCALKPKNASASTAA